jgi:hypothetical protein
MCVCGECGDDDDEKMIALRITFDSAVFRFGLVCLESVFVSSIGVSTCDGQRQKRPPNGKKVVDLDHGRREGYSGGWVGWD